MPCNWLALVRGNGEARACVFCGQHRREHSKPVSMASVLALLDAQDPALHGELFARALRNVCRSAAASHAQCMPAERQGVFGACLCCHHWVARRKRGNLLFPLQALAWYVNTMLPVDDKHMDHQVIKRLCQTLHEHGPRPTGFAHDTCSAADTAHTLHGGATDDTVNHYSTLFNTQENALFARIAAGSIDSVGVLITQFYHRENACTIFLPSTALVEKLRKIQARRA